MQDLRYEYIKKVGGGATCETFLIKHKDMDAVSYTHLTLPTTERV